MIKKIIAVVIIFLMFYGTFQIYSSYRNYKIEKAARIARLQAQAEEIKVTTIEGWNTADIARTLDKTGLVGEQDFEKLTQDYVVSNYPLIQKPSKTDLEGYLFPDTYRFAKNSTPEQILEKILDNFTTRIKSLGMSVEGDIVIPGYENLDLSGGGDGTPGVSLYDVLTMASIIEQESGGKGAGNGMSLEEERAIIAGVFYNRLTIGQALESDATVNYITGKNSPGASYKDLEINSPYNTYKYPGLPPGPICNPSLGSIKAALAPKKTDFYFFLHKQPSGEVMFSKTFEEHKNKR